MRHLRVFLALVFAALGLWGTVPKPLSALSEAQPAGDARSEAAARAVCTTCHVLPPPDILPKASWRYEFLRMKFIREQKPEPSGSPEQLRQIPLPEDMEKALPYYMSHAPDHLPP